MRRPRVLARTTAFLSERPYDAGAKRKILSTSSDACEPAAGVGAGAPLIAWRRFCARGIRTQGGEAPPSAATAARSSLTSNSSRAPLRQATHGEVRIPARVSYQLPKIPTAVMVGLVPIGARTRRENPLPPCGGGLGWGVARTYPYLGGGSNPGNLARPPTPALPHKGGGSSRRQSFRKASTGQPWREAGHDGDRPLILAPMRTSPAMTGHCLRPLASHVLSQDIGFR
jgi:hypothetical protein